MNDLDKAIEEFCAWLPHNNAIIEYGKVYHGSDEGYWARVVYSAYKEGGDLTSKIEIFKEKLMANPRLGLSEDKAQKHAEAFIDYVSNCRSVLYKLKEDKLIDVKQ